MRAVADAVLSDDLADDFGGDERLQQLCEAEGALICQIHMHIPSPLCATIASRKPPRQERRSGQMDAGKPVCDDSKRILTIVHSTVISDLSGVAALDLQRRLDTHQPRGMPRDLGWHDGCLLCGADRTLAQLLFGLHTRPRVLASERWRSVAVRCGCAGAVL